MNATDQQNFEALARFTSGHYVKSFKDCSESLDQNGNPFNPPKYCLGSGSASNYTAFDFDSIMSDWTGLPSRMLAGKNLPTRIDSLYPKGNDIYLVEFKRNSKRVKPFPNIEITLHRKIYDSILNLVEHNVRTVDQCRKDVIYVVVMSKLPRLSAKDIEVGRSRKLPLSQQMAMQVAIFNQVASFVQRPWRIANRFRSQYGLWKIDGVVCRQTHTIESRQFDAFAKDMQWT